MAGTKIDASQLASGAASTILSTPAGGGTVTWAPATVLTATQSSGTSSTPVTLPGTTITLTPGTWDVRGYFTSMRGWTVGAGATVFRYHIIRTSDTNLYATGILSLGTGTELVEAGPELSVIITVTSNTDVALYGEWAVTSGTNFSAGFRWDSGAYGAPSKITAVRIR